MDLILKARDVAIKDMQANCIHRGASRFFKPDVDSNIVINYIPGSTSDSVKIEIVDRLRYCKQVEIDKKGYQPINIDHYDKVYSTEKTAFYWCHNCKRIFNEFKDKYHNTILYVNIAYELIKIQENFNDINSQLKSIKSQIDNLRH